MATNNFYEDDEPDDKIRAAFEQGEKGRTRPRDLNQRAAAIVSDSTLKTEPSAIQFAAVDEAHSVEVVGLTFEERRPVRITRRADVTIRS